MGRGARLALEVAAPFPLDVQLLAPPSDAEGGEGGEGGHGGEEGGEGGGEGGGEEGGEGGGARLVQVAVMHRYPPCGVPVPACTLAELKSKLEGVCGSWWGRALCPARGQRPSARPVPPRARAAPTHPGAPPERLGSSRWPQEAA